jgi:Methylase involved in ubiquinone/menaquinone biosynthesis
MAMGKSEIKVLFNWSNPYSQKFLDLLVANGGIVLDCGSYERRLYYDRLMNMDIEPVPGVDVKGDGHSLPFKDNSFDLILSQGVLEHCRQPFQAADELYRVCRLGGIIYADAAFMQPVHGFLYHFFNMTELGIEELFRKFHRIESGSFGGLSSTVPWMMDLTGIAWKKLYAGLIKWLIGRADRYNRSQDVKKIAPVVYYIGSKGPARSGAVPAHRQYTVVGDPSVARTGSWSTVVNYNAFSRQLT